MNEHRANLTFGTRDLVDPAVAAADDVEPIMGTISVMVVALRNDSTWRCFVTVPDHQCEVIERECKPR